MKYLNLTEKLDSEEKALIFEESLNKLKSLNLDADTCEILLNELGTIDEIFSFLIGQERYLTARKVWDDISEKGPSAYENFDDYFNDNFMDEL